MLHSLAVLCLACCVCALRVRARLPVVSDFVQYSESHALRAWHYVDATNCEPYTAFVAAWAAAGAYPHVTAVAPDTNATAFAAATFSTHVSSAGVDDDIFGIVATDPADHAVLVTVRGAKRTATMKNWIEIVQIAPKDAELCPPNTATNSSSCVKFKSHSGFWDAFQSARRQVESLVAAAVAKYPDGLIHVIGHSLGAALSLLFGADLALAYPGKVGSIYAIGQPLVASQPLLTYLEAQQINYFRVTSQLDPVPHLPKVSPLVHGGTEVWYPKGAAAGGPYQVCPPPWVSDHTCSEAAFAAQCPSALICFAIYSNQHTAYFGGICLECAAVPSSTCT